MSSIVVLPSIIFPRAIITSGVSGVLSRQNRRGRNQAGYASVTAVRDVTMRAWQIGTGPMRQTAAEQLFGIYETTDAGAFGFLFEDPIDSAATLANGALQGYMLGVEYGEPGFGNGCPVYGLRKEYPAGFSALKRARAWTRPNGTVAVTRGGTPVMVGAGAGNIAFSAAPVYVTFVADSSQAVTAITAGASTVVTLAAALPGLVVGGRLWLQDVSGADQALVNNQSHAITSISGGGANTYTLATNTAGKTLAANGTGKKYPQPDEALRCAGSFYIPVHFRDDNINWELVIAGASNKREIVIPNTYLDEIREA